MDIRTSISVEDAIEAGHNGPLEQTIALDVSTLDADEREALAYLIRIGSGVVQLREPGLAGLRAIIASRVRQAHAERLASEERRAAAQLHARIALARPVADWLVRQPSGQWVARMPVPDDYHSSHWDDYQAALQEVEGYAQRLCEAARLAQAREAAETAAKQQARAEAREWEARLEARKIAWLESWLTEHGPESLRAQWADGLLDRRVLLRIVAERELDQLGLPPAADITGYALEDIHTLPPEVYPAWQRVRASLPTGTTWQLERWTSSEEEEEGEEEVYGVRLRVRVGPFRFERRVQLS